MVYCSTKKRKITSVVFFTFFYACRMQAAVDLIGAIERFGKSIEKVTELLKKQSGVDKQQTSAPGGGYYVPPFTKDENPIPLDISSAVPLPPPAPVPESAAQKTQAPPPPLPRDRNIKSNLIKTITGAVAETASEKLLNAIKGGSFTLKKPQKKTITKAELIGVQTGAEYNVQKRSETLYKKHKYEDLQKTIKTLESNTSTTEAEKEMLQKLSEDLNIVKEARGNPVWQALQRRVTSAIKPKEAQEPELSEEETKQLNKEWYGKYD